MSAITTKRYTIEEFMRLPEPIDGSKEELVQGEIVTMPPPSHHHGRTVSRIIMFLESFAEQQGSGHTTAESGVVTERDPDSARGPDVAYWSVARLPLHSKVTGYAEVAPDLCVEVISEHTRAKQLKRKLREYFTAGVRMVWVADTEKHNVTVYRSPTKGKLIQAEDFLDGDDVLPGFSCQVAKFFPY